MPSILTSIFKRNTLLAALAIFVIGFLSYSNSFNGEFCSDDHITIVTNPAIRDIGDWSGLWHSFNTRFLVGLSFAFNYQLNGLGVFDYHVLNFLFHMGASFLVYAFVQTIFQTPALVSDRLVRHKDAVAFYAALIFVCHPVQVQGVTYITQRAVSMATLFYLGAVVSYLQFRLGGRKFFYWLAAASMLLGIFCKEFLVTVPAALFLCEVYFLQLSRGRIGQLGRSLSPFFVLALLVPALLILDQRSSTLHLFHQLKGNAFSRDYFFTEINVLVTYLRMLVLPVNLNHSYDYPIAHGLGQLTTAGSLAVLATLLAFGIGAFRKHRVISFTVLWFFLATCVEFAVVCFVHKGVIYDHWLYLAMLGFALFVPAAALTLVRDPAKAKVVLIILVAALSVMTYQRNRVWQTCASLWEDAVKKSPDDQLPLINLGVEYSRAGHQLKAIACYQKALSIDRTVDDSRMTRLYINLGTAYGRAGDYEKEIEYNRKALGSDPFNGMAYSNLGLAYLMTGRYDQALDHARKAVMLGPRDANGYNNLGLVYLYLGELERAEENFRRAVAIDPENANAVSNLNKLLQQKER